MDAHERRLVAFLAGDLDEEHARQVDEHLLGCEECWRAVQEDRLARQALALLHEAEPPGLADRIRFAVELAPPPQPRRPLLGLRRRGRAVVGTGLAAALSIGVIFGWLLPGSPADPTSVLTVLRFARSMPPAAGQPAGPRPVAVGEPMNIVAAGQALQLRYYRVDGVEAVLATSAQPFPVPASARATTEAGGMTWTVHRGALGLFCVDGPGGRSALLAAPLPTAALAQLMGELISR